MTQWDDTHPEQVTYHVSQLRKITLSSTIGDGMFDHIHSLDYATLSSLDGTLPRSVKLSWIMHQI